jgi:hypothetical protein
MQSLEQKRKGALATLQHQRDRFMADHDEAQDLANVLYAQLRNNAELTQRIRFRMLSFSRCLRSIGHQHIEPLAKGFSYSADRPVWFARFGGRPRYRTATPLGEGGAL